MHELYERTYTYTKYSSELMGTQSRMPLISDQTNNLKKLSSTLEVAEYDQSNASTSSRPASIPSPMTPKTTWESPTRSTSTPSPQTESSDRPGPSRNLTSIEPPFQKKI